MSNADIHKAHKLLDYVSQGRAVLDDEIKLLRSFLPERPKDATLVDLIDRVHAAWLSANPSDWGFDTPAEHHDWLFDLRNDLVRIIEEQDAPAAVPALPAGMRLAEHVNFGRVVVSPGVGIDRCHEIFYLEPGMSSGTDISEVEPDSLTFIDAEPAKPAHPEFLETEADYQSAPRGTVAAKDGWKAWLKETDGVWSCGGGSDEESRLAQTGKRRVLRWGWGE